MRGLILNEDGYVTYPAKIFEPIKDYVRSLNWKLTNPNLPKTYTHVKKIFL
jgi:hypothetical protein